MSSDCETRTFECMQQTARIMPLQSADNITAIVTLIEDVTERVDREQDLSASEARYRSLVENARDSVLVIQGSAIVQSNPSARTLFGLSGAPHVQESDFRRFQAAIDPRFVSPLTARYADRMAGKPIPHLFSFQITDQKGEKRWLESNSAAITWEEKPAILAMLRDITRRKKTEESLHEERKRLAVTLRSIGDGVIATDADGKVLFINRVAEELTGYPFEDALGETL